MLPTHYNTCSLPYSTLPCPTLPYPALPYSALTYPTPPYPALPCPALPNPTLRYPALPYSALPCPPLPTLHNKQAVLEELLNKGAKMIITTHYSQLKGLAIVDSRFSVAAMQFVDARPTYKVRTFFLYRSG